MRLYSKPQLNISLFDLEEDIITASITGGDLAGENTNWASAPRFQEYQEYVNELTVENPSGKFDAQITGGNPVQEALNTLYENFVNRM